MDALSESIQCRPGDEVFGSDDHKVGKVTAFDRRFLTVEHGLIHKSEYFVPISAVNACDSGKVYLNITKDEVARQGWDVPPMVETDADGRALGG